MENKDVTIDRKGSLEKNNKEKGKRNNDKNEITSVSRDVIK